MDRLVGTHPMSGTDLTVFGRTVLAMSRDQPQLIGISCRCEAAWSGEDRMHCGGCHRTFDTVELFDDHRRNDRCIDPRALGLTPTKNHIWCRPPETAGSSARRAG
jgi:hypothetical protein